MNTWAIHCQRIPDRLHTNTRQARRDHGDIQAHPVNTYPGTTWSRQLYPYDHKTEITDIMKCNVFTI